jgi:pilus assembly protein CpaC
VRAEGFVTPGISTRRASTKIELADGQSFAIAGLLREAVRADISKFPLLGDLPVIGPLFQSKSFQKSETELVIIVTPHLVKPMELAKQSLPTDSYIEPSDAEFYLQGAIEGKSNRHAVDVKEGFEGEFGHSIPED